MEYGTIQNKVIHTLLFPCIEEYIGEIPRAALWRHGWYASMLYISDYPNYTFEISMN